MAYRENKLGLLVRLQPRQASAQILAAYRACSFNEHKAAARLRCGRTSLKRWVAQLKIHDQIVKGRADLARAGRVVPQLDAAQARPLQAPGPSSALASPGPKDGADVGEGGPTSGRAPPAKEGPGPAPGPSSGRATRGPRKGPGGRSRGQGRARAPEGPKGGPAAAGPS